MKIRLVQFNSWAGALGRNAEGIVAAARDAAAAGVDAVFFPAQALCGQPLGQLVVRKEFKAAIDAELERLAATLPPEITVVLGTTMGNGLELSGGALAFRGGKMEIVCRMRGLMSPYDMPQSGTMELGGLRVGVCISGGDRSGKLPEGCDLLVRLGARPWLRRGERYDGGELRETARTAGVPVLYVNQTGGQDECVFGGEALALDRKGNVRARAPLFGEGTLDVEIGPRGGVSGPIAPEPDEVETIYGALRTGIRDYTLKNHFPGAQVALSGGIDSALVAALAVDALGPERVMGVTLPSTVTSSETLEDALDLARRLGIPCLKIPIAPAVEAITGMLEPAFASVDWAKPLPGTLVEENLQARVRGVVTMALSNRYGHLVLATGNKSESYTGYATLYGDMCGGYAPIKEVPKTMVFALARWRNRQGEVIPPSTIARPPSAELRPGQKDTDSLPPYEILDPILDRFVEDAESVADLVASGVPEDTARRVARLALRSEYKRRQAAPGVALTLTFPHLPLTNGFEGW